MQDLLALPTDILEAKAARGSVKAQVVLGIVYTSPTGRTAPANHAKAAECFAAAALRGRVDAKWNLGKCYLEGKGVQKNEARALELFEEIAARGDLGGKISIAEIYIENRKSRSQLVRAADLLLEAGQSKDVFTKGDALFALERLDTIFQQKARGIEKDVPAAVVKETAKRVSAFVTAHASFGR